MDNTDFAYELKQLKQTVAAQNELFQNLPALANPKDEMWDDQDMIQNWKVSKRLLADWRKEGIISYVQYKNKIWYPYEARMKFIAKYMVENSDDKIKINPAITN